MGSKQGAWGLWGLIKGIGVTKKKPGDQGRRALGVVSICAALQLSAVELQPQEQQRCAELGIDAQRILFRLDGGFLGVGGGSAAVGLVGLAGLGLIHLVVGGVE